MKCALSSTGQTKDEFKRAITSLPAGLPGEATGEAVLSPLPSRSWLWKVVATFVRCLPVPLDGTFKMPWAAFYFLMREGMEALAGARWCQWERRDPTHPLLHRSGKLSLVSCPFLSWVILPFLFPQGCPPQQVHTHTHPIHCPHPQASA